VEMPRNAGGQRKERDSEFAYACEEEWRFINSVLRMADKQCIR
jgi:hypothetical protein